MQHTPPASSPASALPSVPSAAGAERAAALAPRGDRMRALTFTGAGGVDRLAVVDDAPLPRVANSDVLVRVLASGVNPIEVKTRAGSGIARLIDYPFVAGAEFAGVVVSVPYEASPLQPGDEVWGMVLTPHYQGAQAEYVSVPLLSVTRKPDSLDWDAAGAVPLAALTAWTAVIEIGRIVSGQRVLIHAGAGGVGHFAVQLAHFYGAHVITTASSPNHDWLRDLGADEVIDYRTTRFEEAIDEPVDLVIDLIGNVHDDTGSRSLQVLRDGGLIINVPTGSWPSMFDEVAAADRAIRATTLKISPDARILTTLAQLVDQGDLRVELDAVYPLERAADAHTHIESGHARGKVVLDLRPESSATTAD